MPKRQAVIPYHGSNKSSAFLHYILFDEEYKVIEAESTPVGAADVLHAVVLPAIQVKELGYLFVYLSYDNESAHWVHFDELKIAHTESPVLQVNAYYPFGLLACTWLRDGEKENLYGYQGKEYDSLTRWHDFHARQYDPALGRFKSIDPANQFASGYVGMGNNPVIGVDPDGEVFQLIPFLIKAYQIYNYARAAINMVQAYKENGLIGLGQAIASEATGLAIGSLLGPLSGGNLVDFANIKGALPGGLAGGLTGALAGGLAGGINSWIWGGDISDGFRGGALGGGLTGALSGGYWGYTNAKHAGKNVWWGNEVKNNRTQTSFFNFVKPDVYRSPIKSTGGSEIPGGCVPKALENTGLLYDVDENYFATEYAKYLGAPSFPGKFYDTHFESFVESLPGPLFVDSRVKLDQIAPSLEAGKRIIGGMNSYVSPNSPLLDARGHVMNLVKLKIWPSGYFKMRFINPDGGGFFSVNKFTYSKYGPWRWFAIYR